VSIRTGRLAALAVTFVCVLAWCALALLSPGPAVASRQAEIASSCPGSVSEGGRAVTLKAVAIVTGRGVGCRRTKRLIRRYLNDALAFGDCYALAAGGRSTCRVAGWTFYTRCPDRQCRRLRVRPKRSGRSFRFLRVDQSHVP
jgi:hypothetical protein